MSRIIQSIGMVNAQTVHLAFSNQFKNQTVSSLKNAFILDANAGEIVGVEEPPVVDVIGGDPPVGQAIGLRFDKFVKLVEAGRVVRSTIDRINGRPYAVGDFQRSRA